MFLGSLFGSILGTVFFLMFQAAGILFIFKLFPKDGSSFSRLIIGSVFGTLLLQWIPFLTALITGFNRVGHLIALVLVYVALFILLIRDKGRLSLREEHRSFLISAGHNVHVIILFALMMVLWSTLLFRQIIPFRADGSIHTGQANYGDMSMHLGFLTSIAVQDKFPPEYSIFPGTRLAYPFLCDSVSSSVYIWGASLRFAYVLPMIFAFAQLIGTVYIIAKRVLNSALKALLALILFFFNGGLGFIWFINWSQDGRYTFSDIFNGYYTTPTNLVEENIRWSNVINDMFLPQRATLFGYAVLFPAIYLLYVGINKNSPKYFRMAAIFGGALPLIHTHSFLAYALVCAGFLFVILYNKVFTRSNRLSRPIAWGILIFMLVICNAIKKDHINTDFLMKLSLVVIAVVAAVVVCLLIKYLNKDNIRDMLMTWGTFLVIVLVLSLPQLLCFTFNQVSEGGFVRGWFNWANLGDNYIWFYIKNLGIMAVLGFIALTNTKNKDLMFAFPVFLIWFLAETIVFTPNTYDNNKLLYVGYLIICIISVDFASRVYESIKHIGSVKVLAWITLILCTVSGILSISREVISDYELYGKDQVDMAMWVEENTDKDSVFLTSDRHNNVIACLTGRKIVCGSGLFLYFHGIENNSRLEEVRRMYEDPEGTQELYNKYDVDYICVSAYELNNYSVNEYEISSLYELVYSDNGVRLYRVAT